MRAVRHCRICVLVAVCVTSDYVDTQQLLLNKCLSIFICRTCSALALSVTPEVARP